ncbi:unnamed protein product [Cuscuta campestris]|uniref:Uncharacterized protein n=1 Tax=Cuscuta campestris TaxID=132261 RepID=A0A484L393_9ASTE|nr:unnamed protein product [Cuscuta campestris]
MSPAATGPQFEFDESDVVWDNGDDFDRGGPGGARRSSASIPGSRRPVVAVQKKNPKADDRPASLPVSVPEWADIRRESGGGEKGAVVPPHEYLARRRGASMSVHEGIGRTLKGRDLSRVRIYPINYRLFREARELPNGI